MRREETTEVKTRDKRTGRRYDCGCLFFFSLFKIFKPSNNFEFSKLPLPFCKKFKFPDNVLVVKMAN